MERESREEVEVYSEKYDIHGVVRDYGMVMKLFFTYEGKDIVMGVHRNILKDEKYEDLGRNIIDSYVTNLASHEEGKKLQLHYWYIGEHEIHAKGYKYAMLVLDYLKQHLWRMQVSCHLSSIWRRL